MWNAVVRKGGFREHSCASASCNTQGWAFIPCWLTFAKWQIEGRPAVLPRVWQPCMLSCIYIKARSCKCYILEKLFTCFEGVTHLSNTAVLKEVQFTQNRFGECKIK